MEIILAVVAFQVLHIRVSNVLTFADSFPLLNGGHYVFSLHYKLRSIVILVSLYFRLLAIFLKPLNFRLSIYSLWLDFLQMIRFKNFAFANKCRTFFSSENVFGRVVSLDLDKRLVASLNYFHDSTKALSVLLLCSVDVNVVPLVVDFVVQAHF